jgi:hypothetical protein
MIKLTDLLKEEESFTATSKKTGQTSVFKSKDSRDAAVKAGTHSKVDDKEDDKPKKEKPNMFSKDSGYDTPDSPKEEPTKYDDASFWKDDEKDDSTGIDHYDGDTGDFYDDDDDDYGGSSEETKQTTERLDKIDKALDDELKLSKRGFSMNRSSAGGGGGFEGPLEISHDDADYDNPEKVAQLSIGSGEQNGKFTIGFTNLDGEALFNDEYSLTDDDFEPQVAYKMAKEIMKMPEVEKLLKGELSIEKFTPMYDKLKSKFNKSSKEEPKEEPTKDEPVKDSTKERAGNPKINKAVNSKAKELGITPQKLGKEEYESRMSKAAVEALTDANFHSEARKLISVLEDNPDFAKDPNKDPNKPDPFKQPDEYDEWRANSVYASTLYDSADGTDEIAHLATNQSGWEGETSVDAIAFDLKMNGSKELAAKIQSIFEGTTKRGFKNHRLKDFLK